MIPHKKEILVQLIRMFNGPNFLENTRQIFHEHRQDKQGLKEIAVCRALAMSIFGLALERDDGKEPLDQCTQRALEREKPSLPPLTVLHCACNGCRASHIHVTDLCQNCTKKPCLAACRFNAISNDGKRSIIDTKNCKKCSACLRACPYGAIVKTIVPCENACPIDAIAKDEKGHAVIDFAKCIGCGKCMAACPFESIQVRSQIIDVLRAIKSKKKVIALMAPALLGQFKCSAEQLHTAMKKIGFSFVYEVAIGAESTSFHEAKDLEERLARGEKFMTTSCCAAYNNLVKKHIPELEPFVSSSGTPLFYTAEYVREKHGDGVLVFISPCLAKYEEVFANKKVDFVLSCEEIEALLEAFSIIPGECEEEAFPYQTAQEAREFATSGGVSRAVQSVLDPNGKEVTFTPINGLDREVVKDLKRFAKARECERGTVLEVMSCQGGCIGGGLVCCPVATALRQVKNYGEKGLPLSDKKPENA
ncbi:MAG: 4Fe-4S binding protein [Puniceicoccales bacterium]|jgi:[FeFe] hydrogenase (group B1/B3)|nr:4Fe-4S binding protein [Puniceicoccales bacterium]